MPGPKAAVCHGCADVGLEGCLMADVGLVVLTVVVFALLMVTLRGLERL